MERFRQILRKILFPGLAMVLISIPVTAALLIYILAQKHENSPIAYPSYVFSAYALVIVCARIARNAGHVKENLKASIDKYRLHSAILQRSLSRYMFPCMFPLGSICSIQP